MKSWQEARERGRQAAEKIDVRKVDCLEWIQKEYVQPYGEGSVLNVYFAIGYLIACVEQYQKVHLA